MNDIKTAAFIAYKSIIKGNKSTVILLVVILTLSFTNMMFMSGILRGFSALVPQMTIDQISGDIILSPQETPQVKQFIINQTNLRTQIDAVSGVIASTRRYTLAGSFAFDKDKTGQYRNQSAAIMGIDPAQDAKVLTFRKLMRYGQFLSDTDTDQIILSSALAGGYGDIAASDLGGVKVGNKVTVTYINGITRTYTVKGIWHDNMSLMESFVSAREAESVLGVYDKASQILVKVDLQKNSIDTYFHKIKRLAPSIKVQTYKEEMGTFAALENALNLVALIVSVISVIVSAVTLFVLFYINALNKRRQIGILKAIGIKQKIIIYSYMFQAIFYTTISLLIGSFLVFGVLYPLFLKYPLNVDIGELSLFFTPGGILASIVSFAVSGILAGIIPSRMVAKEEILKAIWG